MQLFGFILICYLLADFIAGFWHWLEDRYFDVTWPIIGKYIASPNELHHSQPLAFLDQSYWSRNWTTIVPSAIAFGIALPSPWALIFVFTSQANEIHAWAHRKGKLPAWVEDLQE